MAKMDEALGGSWNDQLQRLLDTRYGTEMRKELYASIKALGAAVNSLDSARPASQKTVTQQDDTLIVE